MIKTFRKSYIPKDFCKNFLVKDAPNITIKDIIYCENGTLCVDKQRVSGAVYDKKGNLCEQSVTYRFSGIMKPAPFCKCDNFINEQVIFMGCGYIFQHFGHFLLEGLSRTYPMLNKKFHNKKFVIVVDKATKKLPGYVLDILGGLGIKSENIILIDKTTRFAGVYVPPQATIITKYMCNIMNMVYDTISNNIGKTKIKTYKKIYLSRSKMNDGRTFGESQIEKIFEKNGYKIVWPETLPLSEQIALAYNCEVMAGTAGTALHLSLFMKPGGTVVQIKRNMSPDDNAEIQNDICNLRKLNFIYVAGSIENKPTKHFTDVPQIVGVTPYVKQFFDENKFEYTDKDIVFDKDAWTRYEKQMRKYKVKRLYKKIINLFVRIASLVGITKYGRQIIRGYLINKIKI